MPMQPGSGLRRALRWAFAIVALACVVLVGDAVWAGMRGTEALRDARVHLRNGREALMAGDLRIARESFGAAAEASNAATGALGEPGPRVVEWLPVVGDDVGAVRLLAGAASTVARAGATLTEAAVAAGWDGHGIPGYEPPKLDVDAVGATRDDLARAAQLLAGAHGRFAGLDPEGLVGPIHDAFLEARRQVGDGARLARRGAALATVVPRLFGAEGRRAYALVVMNLSDPRGSGGYPGSFGILRARDGRIRLSEFVPTAALGTVPAVEPPRPDVRRYARFGALTHFISTTYPPDWPTSGELFLRMWDASGRRPALDGAIGVDAVFLANLLEAVGGVRIPEIGWTNEQGGVAEELTADNAVRILGRETFETTSIRISNRRQAALGAAAWHAIVSRLAGADALASALSRSVADRHLQVYVRDATDQAILNQLGATGELDLGERDALISMNGVTPSRAGYFADTSVDMSFQHAGDRTKVEVKIVVRNAAPSGPPSILLGFERDGYPVGTYAALVDVFLPADATGIRSRVGGELGLQLVEEEFGRPVIVQVIQVLPGSSAELVVRYTLPPEGPPPRVVPPIEAA